MRLTLRLFKCDALAQRRIELLEFNLALSGLSILTSPNNVVGLRGFEPKQAVLGHKENVTERLLLSNRLYGTNTLWSAFLHFKMRCIILDGNSHRTALHDPLIDH